MALDRVKQTSKTLLIEEFNPNHTDLSTLISSEDIHRKSEFSEKVRENLEVSTFKEFVEKFAPTVYEYTVQNDDPDLPMSFQYTFEKKEGASEVEISKHAFYRMVMDIYEDRAESGISNTKTDTFKRIEELLSPQSALKQAMRTRKQLEYVEKQLDKLKDVPGIEQKRYKARRKEIRKDIIKTYNKSAIGLIPLALADTEKKIESLGISQKDSDGNKEEKIIAIPCKYSFDDNGGLIVEKVEKPNNIAIDQKTGEKVEVIEMMDATDDADLQKIDTTISGDIVNADKSNVSGNLADRLAKDFEAHSNAQAKGEFFKNLVVEVYTGKSLSESGAANISPDIEKLERKKTLYTNIYKNAQEQFINKISDTVEKMLGVKVFFDHASRNGKPLMAPLIVANCKVSALLEHDVKEDFTYYIEEMSRENEENAIWFAIIPSIGDSDFTDRQQYYDDGYDDYDDDISDDELNSANEVKSEDGKELVTRDSCKAMLEILKNGKIITFFNYKANDKTGFNRFTADIIRKYKDKLESLNGNKYAVFTYPNFTLIPKENTCIKIGSVKRDGEYADIRLNLPGIYVESSYVAAGLVVGSQDPYILKEKGFKIKNLTKACVRFDFEEGDNNKLMLTRMAREGDTIWDSQAEAVLNEDMFGFSFCGNCMYYDNKPVKNSYVYATRTMGKDSNSKNYKSLYKTLTARYISTYLSTYGGSSVRESDVKKFLKDVVKSWKHDLVGDNTKDEVNNILRDGEDVYFLNEDKQIHVKFRDGEERIDIGVVEDN